MCYTAFKIKNYVYQNNENWVSSPVTTCCSDQSLKIAVFCSINVSGIIKDIPTWNDTCKNKWYSNYRYYFLDFSFPIAHSFSCFLADYAAMLYILVVQGSPKKVYFVYSKFLHQWDCSIIFMDMYSHIFSWIIIQFFFFRYLILGKVGFLQTFH